MTQSLGLGRVLGQIYAYLYFCPDPRNLADIQLTLGVSKGSASTGVRQLEQWNAVRKIWVRGDRRDYYEANDWLGEIIRNVLADTVGKRLGGATSLLNSLEEEVDGLGDLGDDGNREFIEKRIDNLRTFHGKTQKVWNSPIVKMLLK